MVIPSQPALLHRQRGAEPGAGAQRRGGRVIERERAGQPGAAELLGPALQEPAEHRDVLVHVDERAEVGGGAVWPRHLQEHDGLPVLRQDRVEELVAVGGGLPVGEVHGAAAGGPADRRRDEGGGPLRVALELDVEEPAGVVPGRRRDQRGQAAGREGGREGGGHAPDLTSRPGVRSAPERSLGPRGPGRPRPLGGERALTRR